tara:strand:+ start:974 stop:1633 length:660 start_codon:yes stop_codon:yes gene_type:complete
MIIQCKSCSRKFVVKDTDIPKEGRTVQCGYCSATWLQKPSLKLKKVQGIKNKKIVKKPIEIKNNLSVENIKASDGKTYRFLGSQWAELLPSGKTGLFAKKKIGKELDKITGREVEKESQILKNKKKRIEEVNPSESVKTSRQSTEIYQSKNGLGFFGFIFLLIIVGFSIVGILKTFEADLVEYFPEIQYIFEILDQQLIYFSETIKNLITIINDLINSY